MIMLFMIGHGGLGRKETKVSGNRPKVGFKDFWKSGGVLGIGISNS
jgi:hypothetical protein